VFKKSLKKITLVSVITLLFMAACNADDFDGSIDDAELEDVTGIIIDRAVTFNGHNFHRFFSDYWRIEFPENGDVLTIFERPSARWGSLIWIEYRSKQVFKTFLNIRSKDIEKLAATSAEQVNKRLIKIKLAELFQDTFDIGKDEI